MKPTKEEFAEMLDGRQMLQEITPREVEKAKAFGLVVIFGYSDDCVELRGAITDEISAYDGAKFRVAAEGVVPQWDDGKEKNKKDAEEFFRMQSLPGADIEAVWGGLTFSWTFRTGIPHATFEIYDDDEPFCRGIVFSMEDLPK